jgi:hypothetical protein
MSDTFAATAAQTIPVFALALVLELRAATRKFPFTRPWTKAAFKEQGPMDLLTLALIYFIWGGVMIWLLRAEYLCLRQLQEMPVPETAANTVHDSIMAALVMLIIIPIVGSLLVDVVAFLSPILRKNDDENADTDRPSQSADKLSPQPEEA